MSTRTASRKGFHGTRFHRSALAAAVVLVLAGTAAQAQLSTATIQGQITTGAAAAKAGVSVVAVNQANGNSYRASTRADGSYVLAGLPPGSYQIRIDGQNTQVVTVAVGETARIDLALSAAAGQQVTIVGTLGRKDVINSEVGTSVSRKQIEMLPQTTRNFLSFADLAPGVRFDTDSNGYVTLRSGSQNQDNINIFIDGVSQKNNILRGGAGGMDSTRGNPFPQSAVGEYKVISQNYKAEFDQVSSVAITAVTKSGTNEVHGDVFVDYTSNSLVQLNPIEQQNKANGNPPAAFKQEQYGFTVGGPIKTDVAHYFVAFEGKNIATPRNVGLASVANLLPNAGLAATFLGMQGSHNQTFHESLLLGKYDLEMGQDSHLDVTARIRRESDFIAENSGLSAPGNDKNRTNDETRLDLRHTLTRDTFVNEARLGYEQYEWHPKPGVNAPEIKYYISKTNQDVDKQSVIWTGGSPDAQDRAQKGLLFQDDLAYTGMAGHSMKFGAKLKLMKYNLDGTALAVDVYEKLLSNTTGNPIVFPNGNDYLTKQAAINPVGVNFKNNQFGIYAQDDWKFSKQLELNLGARWDYESNMLNNGYVTPADRVTALHALDTARYGITPPAGQTYAQALAKGGINIDDYISTGSNRKPFYGALSPRLGFSFDLNGDKATVIYGGMGRSYDRAMANYALDELQKNASNKGETFLIRNKFKMPFTDQFSLGLRQAVGQFNTEVGLTHSDAKNQFNWFAGDRDPNGGWGSRANSIDPNWGAGPAGYGMLILGDFISHTTTDTLFLKADKPYTASSGWSGGITYTYSDGKTTNRDWTTDIFNWGYGKPGEVGALRPSVFVERHRVVAQGLTDKLLPWGMTLSGTYKLGSGLPYRITTCTPTWDICHSYRGDANWTRQLDVAIGKDFAVPGGKLNVRMDVLNLLNTVNWTGYDSWGGGPGNPQNWTGGDNAGMGKANGIGMPMRTIKLAARYIF